MLKRLLLFLFVMALMQMELWAQNVVLSGRIVDTKNEPQFGIAILLLGSGKGATTDFDGKYKFNIPEEALKTGQIKVSGIGYKQQIIPLNNRAVINITLEEEAKTLKEAVVTGIAKPKERKVYDPTNSTTISYADIKQAPVPSFAEALQGKAPGLQITQSSGIAGSATNIRIRGTGSMTASSDPLVVVDGIPVISGAGGDGGGGIGAGLNMGFQTSALANINPNDIENIEVLKDAAACAKYGARGSNGVLLVTTKKGAVGRNTFSFNYQRGYADITNRIDLLDGPQYLRVLDSAYSNTWRQNRRNIDLRRTLPGRDAYLTFPSANQFADTVARRTNTNWMDKLLRIGIMDEMALSASGGNAKTKYFISGTYFNNKGVMVGNNFNRIGGRFNLTNTASDKLQVGINSFTGYTVNDQVPSGANSDAGVQGGFGAAQLRSLPIFPIYKRDAVTTGTDPFAFNPFFNAYGDYGGTNIVLTSDPDYAFYKEKIFRNTTTVFADYKLAQYLNYRVEAGMDFYSQINSFYQSRFLRTTEIDRSQTQSATGDSRVFFNNQNINNIINFSKYLNEINKLDVDLVHNYQRTISYNNGARGEGLPNDETNALSQSQRALSPRSGNESEYTFNSFLAIANYRWKDRFFSQASVRYDGSSRLGPDRRYGFFPAVGVGYLLTEEEFMKKIDWINFLKLKSSFGQTGNAAGINNFQSFGLFSSGGNYTLNPTIVPRQVANRNLTWEKAYQVDASMEFGLFKERVSGSVGYFNKTSYDLLLNLPLPPSSGINTSYFVNTGRLRNQGVELEITTTNLDKKNFMWKTSFNGTWIRNELLSLGGVPGNAAGSLDYISIPGNQMTTFYLPKWAGVNPETGEEEIYEVVKDDYTNPASGYRFTGRKIRPLRIGQIDSNRIPIADKPVLPTFYGGFNNRFTIFKGLEINLLFTFSTGNFLLDQGERRQSYVNGNNNLRAQALEAWTRPGQQTDVPRLYYSNAPRITGIGDTLGQNFWYNNDPLRFRNTTRFLHDGSYVRLRTLTVAYNFQENFCKRIKLKTLRIFVSAQNLLTFTRFKGWDPEVVGNLGSNAERNLQVGTTDLDFPQLRVYTMGINLTF
jgi:TonB-linked SusC/RagA family outer membrane protein